MHSFIELLVSEVKERPVLWNRWDENYKNRVIVDKEWEKVAVVLKKDTSKAHADGSYKTEDIVLFHASSESVTGKKRVVVTLATRHSFDSSVGACRSCAQMARHTSITMAETAPFHIPNEEVICLKWTKGYFISEVEVKSKWRNLRDQFQRELKKVKKRKSGSIYVNDYKGRWVFFEMLFFLKDTMTPTKKSNNFQNIPSTDTLNSETDTNSEDLGQEAADTTEAFKPETSNPHSIRFGKSLETAHLHSTPIYYHSRGRKRTLSDFGRNMLEVERKKLPAFIEHSLYERYEQDDEDMHFVKSLVPSLRRLDPIRKLIIRNKIQSLLIKELIHENSSLSSDSETETSTGDPLAL